VRGIKGGEREGPAETFRLSTGASVDLFIGGGRDEEIDEEVEGGGRAEEEEVMGGREEEMEGTGGRGALLRGGAAGSGGFDASCFAT